MKLRELDIEGKYVKVLDDIFSSNERLYMHRFVVNSQYTVERFSFDVPERQSFHKTLKCGFSITDIINFKFFENEYILSFIKENNLRVSRCYTNLCTASDIYQYHADTNVIGCPTGLYYCNIEWDPTWEGETHFSDDSMRDILFSSAFIPGRLVLFDGTIPHKSSQPAPNAQYYRFVFTIKFANNLCDEWKDSIDIQDFIYHKNYGLTGKEQLCLSYIREKTSNIQHSGTTLYQHLVNTFYVLKSLNQSEEVCLSGLMHSIYGTEYFKHTTETNKQQIIDLIGEYSNNLVEYFCMPDRDNLILNNTLNLNDKINLDLLYILYANLIEQSYRNSYDWKFFTEIRNKIELLK
jgi:hypothetical protein